LFADHKKPEAEIKTIRQERQHAERGDKQANAAEYGNAAN